MTKRPALLLLHLASVGLLCACSSQGGQSTTVESETQDPASAPAGDTPAGAPGDEAPPEAAPAGSCDAEPWQTEDPEASPPAAYLACSADEDCVEVTMAGCCESFRVAASATHRACIAERNARANCRAHCIMPPEDYEPPARTPRCVDGACRLVLEDGTARTVVHIDGPI